MGTQQGKNWMLVLPLGSCEKGETSQRSPVSPPASAGLDSVRPLPEGRSFMAAAQFFFFILAVDLMSTADSASGGGVGAALPVLLRNPSGVHRHSPQVLPRGQDRTATAVPGQGWLGDPSAPGGLPRTSLGEDGFPCAPGNVGPVPVQAEMSPPPCSPCLSPKPRREHHRACLKQPVPGELGIPSHRGERNHSRKGFFNPLWPWIPLPLLCQLNKCLLPDLCSPILVENWSLWEQGCDSGSSL